MRMPTTAIYDGNSFRLTPWRITELVGTGQICTWQDTWGLQTLYRMQEVREFIVILHMCPQHNTDLARTQSKGYTLSSADWLPIE